MLEELAASDRRLNCRRSNFEDRSTTLDATLHSCTKTTAGLICKEELSDKLVNPNLRKKKNGFLMDKPSWKTIPNEAMKTGTAELAEGSDGSNGLTWAAPCPHKNGGQIWIWKWPGCGESWNCCRVFLIFVKPSKTLSNMLTLGNICSVGRPLLQHFKPPCMSATLSTYLLGLLAMIKCSICSYQCDNWYVSNWRLDCHLIFLRGGCMLG